MSLAPSVEVAPFEASVHESAVVALWYVLFRAVRPLSADTFHAQVLTPIGS